MVPEVGGRRSIRQNDGEIELYMLVGAKMRLIEVNTTISIEN